MSERGHIDDYEERGVRCSIVPGKKYNDGNPLTTTPAVLKRKGRVRIGWLGLDSREGVSYSMSHE